MSLMARASGIGQRAAIRAVLGAGSGVLGAAMMEPMIYLGQQEVQADYGLADSLLNVGFGAVMGGVMHSAGGTFAEWRRAKSGQKHPWEFVPEDDDSRALMQAHADDLARYMLEANPNADPSLIRQQALSNASIFDSRARNWAYHERKPVGEYYAQHRPEYRSWQPDFEQADKATGVSNSQEVRTLHQLDNDGNAISPNENNPRIANVVEIQSELLSDRNGRPIDLRDKKVLSQWLLEHYRNKIIRINDDGSIQQFTKKGLNASLKRRGGEQRQAYANLDSLLEKALYDGMIEADERHFGKVAGQKIYYSAAKIGDQYYSVRFKVDQPLDAKNHPSYKDHKVIEIKIEPSLSRLQTETSSGARANGSINGISLSVLKGDVKPSRIENSTLYQSSTSVIGRQTQILGANSKEIGRYEVRELDDVIASHDPDSGFLRRAYYPQEAQERPYHSDVGEQQKVTGNALNYEPAFVLSTDASATNGPPIITQNGIVLGGNSRTMTLQMVYGLHPHTTKQHPIMKPSPIWGYQNWLKIIC